MGEKPDVLVKEMRRFPKYVSLFQKVFGGTPDEAVTFDNVTKAVAAFERTLLSFNSKFDRYAAGDTERAQRARAQRHEALPLAEDALLRMP